MKSYDRNLWLSPIFFSFDRCLILKTVYVQIKHRQSFHTFLSTSMRIFLLFKSVILLLFSVTVFENVSWLKFMSDLHISEVRLVVNLSTCYCLGVIYGLFVSMISNKNLCYALSRKYCDKVLLFDNIRIVYISHLPCATMQWWNSAHVFLYLLNI